MNIVKLRDLLTKITAAGEFQANFEIYSDWLDLLGVVKIIKNNGQNDDLTFVLQADSDQFLARLPEVTDVEQMQVKLKNSLRLKNCVLRFMFGDTLSIESKYKILTNWRVFISHSLKQSDDFWGQKFLALPIDVADSNIAISVPANHQSQFNQQRLDKLQALIIQLLGIRVNFICISADMVAIQRDLSQSYLNEISQIIVNQEARPTSDDNSNNELPSDNGSVSREILKQTGRPQYKKVEGLIFGRWNSALDFTPIKDLGPESGLVSFRGCISNLEEMVVSQGQKILLKFIVEDHINAIQAIMFLKADKYQEISEKIKNDCFYAVQAEVYYDGMYSKDLQARVNAICEAKAPADRVDLAPQKRVELHCHSKMSAKDAISNPADIVALAASFGHKAVAITDHGVVQGFPAAFEASMKAAKQGKPIKLIMGMEGYLIPDGEAIVYGLDLPRGEEMKVDLDFPKRHLDRFVAFDVETTGLNCDKDRVIEIGASRFVYEDGEYLVKDQFSAILNPHIDLPTKITELTGITDAMIAQEGRESLTVIQEFIDFVGDDPVCGHNVLFDLGFIRAEGFKTAHINDPKLKFNPIVIDTVNLAKTIWPHQKNYKLDTVCAMLNIELTNHHRAVDDAKACGEILARALQRDPDLTLEKLNTLSGLLAPEEVVNGKLRPNHIIILAKNLLGLYNLYRLVSMSHTQYFRRRPRIPKSLLAYLKHGLALGTACISGEFFATVKELYDEHYRDLNAALQDVAAYHRYNGAKSSTVAKLNNLCRFYDYLEIMPLTNNSFLTRLETAPYTITDLQNLVKLAIAVGEKNKKLMVATGDSHFLNEEDAIYRKVMMTNFGYSPYEEQANLYFRNTEEMLAEFSYLTPEKAFEYCVTNPNLIADQVEPNLRPFPDGTFPPMISSAADDVRNKTWEQARFLYESQDGMPEIVVKRVERELTSIIDNGFAIMYYIADKLVKKSNDDGYIVGSRGSVGSSFVATLCGITEVNPLPPHYRCSVCRYCEFDLSGNYGSGFDLPAKKCATCDIDLVRDGQDIPFETFLGFNGDKQPDIDLNFSGEYQPNAHQYIHEMFGTAHTFRAGTVGSYALTSALALVRNYAEKTGESINQAGMLSLAKGLDGVKRTTGQHPGGIVVIPKEREIYDFTPIQYPADKLDSVMTTTHFDFTAMHDTILKLDVLGHQDPTMLKVLGDMTGVNVAEIPIPDAKVMSIFESTEALGIKNGTSPADSATLGLPEMGTFMARGMIRETKPTRFYDLVQLMGLSHGTDVWKGNAQDLIKEGICSINEVIGCRDGIMTTLIYYGLPPKAAFDIMEKVRKGKGVSEEEEKLMRDNKVPDWYIESCQKIKYMFPKAHAAAYVISSLRIAWFKVYRPEAYYSAYFTVRADEFDSSLFCKGKQVLQTEKQRLYQAMRDRNAKKKDENLYYIAELVEEMYLRGIEFLPIDLYLSDPIKFLPEAQGQIRPPLNALPNISAAMGKQIAEARLNGEFKNQVDLMKRAGIGQAAVAALKEGGLIDGLPVSAQLALFDLL